MMLTRILGVALFLFSLAVTGSGQAEAARILKKMDQTIFAVQDKTVNMRMVMVDLNTNKEKVKEAVLYQKGADKKLFRYTAPESDAGISTLSLPNNEIYVYLPLFKKPKKVTNLAESGIFNSSDFSLEDMANDTYLSRYSPELVSSDGDAYVLNLTPKEEKPTYGRVVAYINKQHYYPERLDYYDKREEPEKQAQYTYAKVQGFWVATEVTMKDVQKNHQTTIYMSDIRINQGLEDALFTLENLAPGE